MDLICYIHPSWRPLIRPAEATRDWMTDSPESFAYRCLPLNIANAHGWEILSPCAFAAQWNGSMTPADIEIIGRMDVPESLRPVSLFGQGVLTFHIQGLFRTPPKWNLWVGGSPNRFKDAIQPLTGIVETDWAPYTFTMNWRFTRPGQWISFEEGEPIAFIFPLPRAYLDEVEPRIAPMAQEEGLTERFEGWSQSRNAFQAKVAANPPTAPADKWQKSYYRGLDPDDTPAAPDHQMKPRLKPFE
jgi:hypothetical protein